MEGSQNEGDMMIGELIGSSTHCTPVLNEVTQPAPEFSAARQLGHAGGFPFTLHQSNEINRLMHGEMGHAGVPHAQICPSPPISEESALDCDISLSSASYSKQPRPESPPPLASAPGNQSSDNSAVYFLWPPVFRPHGGAEERSAYFKGLQKKVTFTASERAPSGQQATTLLDLMMIRAYNSKLLRGVSLGTAVGFRTRKGVLTNIPAIIVFVAHKVHNAWLHESQRLPMHLEGPGGIWCDVDVVEFYYYGTPAFTPKEQVYTELVEGLRGNDPYIGPGSQVASQETYGTLGAIVRSTTGARQFGFLTNRHVAVDLDYPSQKMYHPLPPNVGPGVYLGAVERATSFITDEGWYNIFASTNPETFVRADGAFIPFGDSFDLSRVRTAVKGVGSMGEVIQIDLQAPVSSIVGKRVVKVGRSSGLTKGSIMAYALEYNDEKGICFFTDFLIVGEKNKQAFDLEGDSGSLILMTEEGSKKPRPVGIIWGGTANRGRLKLRNGNGPENWTSGVDLWRLLGWLQLDLVTKDSDLLEAIEEQRRMAVGGSIVGESSPRPLGIERLAEASHRFFKLGRQNQAHQLDQAELFHFNEPDRLKEGHEFMSASPSGTAPINFIKEIDFLQKVERNTEHREGREVSVPKKFTSEDLSVSLHLFEKDSKRRRQ